MANLRYEEESFAACTQAQMQLSEAVDAIRMKAAQINIQEGIAWMKAFENKVRKAQEELLRRGLVDDFPFTKVGYVSFPGV